MQQSHSLRLRNLYVGLPTAIVIAACSSPTSPPTPPQSVEMEAPRFDVDSTSCRSGYIIANGVVTCRDDG